MRSCMSTLLSLRDWISWTCTLTPVHMCIQGQVKAAMDEEVSELFGEDNAQAKASATKQAAKLSEPEEESTIEEKATTQTVRVSQGAGSNGTSIRSFSVNPSGSWGFQSCIKLGNTQV